MIPGVVRRLEPGEVPAAGRALAAAFQDDALVRFLAPDEAERRRWLPALQTAHVRLTMPDRHSYGAFDGAGALTGALCLAPPGTYPPGPFRGLAMVGTVMASPSARPPRLRHLVRGARYLVPVARLHPRFRHYYVAVLGVAPGWQRQGFGRALMGRAIALAEAARLPLYLETQSEDNVAFYRSLGFEVRARIEPHPLGPPTWTMLRD